MRWLSLLVFIVAGCPVPADGTRDGARCERDDDCDGGLCHAETGRCGRNDCDVVGQACDDDTVCTGGNCERTCEAPQARGATCVDFSDEGGSCGFAATCASGLVCAVIESEARFGACVPPTQRADGDICADDADACAAPLRCDGLYCRPTTTK